MMDRTSADWPLRPSSIGCKQIDSLHAANLPGADRRPQVKPQQTLVTLQRRRGKATFFGLHEPIEQLVHRHVGARQVLAGDDRSLSFREDRFGLLLRHSDERFGLLPALAVDEHDVIHNAELFVSNFPEIPQGCASYGVPADGIFAARPRNASSAFFVTIRRRGVMRTDVSLPDARSSYVALRPMPKIFCTSLGVRTSPRSASAIGVLVMSLQLQER